MEPMSKGHTIDVYIPACHERRPLSGEDFHVLHVPNTKTTAPNLGKKTQTDISQYNEIMKKQETYLIEVTQSAFTPGIFSFKGFILKGDYSLYLWMWEECEELQPCQTCAALICFKKGQVQRWESDEEWLRQVKKKRVTSAAFQRGINRNIVLRLSSLNHFNGLQEQMDEVPVLLEMFKWNLWQRW